MVIVERVCPACAARNPEGNRFCEACGKPLGIPASAQARQAALTQIANGCRFIARLAGTLGVAVTLGGFIFLLREGVLTAGLVLLGGGLATYVVWVVLAAGAELITVVVELERHARAIRESLEKGRDG